jgi:hypothetical protein
LLRIREDESPNGRQARLSVHARAGYASLREYAERVLGLKPRQTEERLRVGRALAELPLLDAALASGEVLPFLVS